MKKLITILFTNIFLSLFTYGQQTKAWLEKIENPKYDIDRLKKEDLKTSYSQFDFSTALTPKSDFLVTPL
jgi:hypothetical protein